MPKLFGTPFALAAYPPNGGWRPARTPTMGGVRVYSVQAFSPTVNMRSVKVLQASDLVFVERLHFATGQQYSDAVNVFQ